MCVCVWGTARCWHSGLTPGLTGSVQAHSQLTPVACPAAGQTDERTLVTGIRGAHGLPCKLTPAMRGCPCSKAELSSRLAQMILDTRDVSGQAAVKKVETTHLKPV